MQMFDYESETIIQINSIKTAFHTTKNKSWMIQVKSSFVRRHLILLYGNILKRSETAHLPHTSNNYAGTFIIHHFIYKQFTKWKL
jgi:hypothetical protein